MRRGNLGRMIGLALALLVVGVIMLFFVPPLGFVAGAVGLVLLVLFLVGFTRRATNPAE